MNKTELNKILKEHKIWLDSDGKEGTRANLSWVNLYRADLYRANLYRANLYGANLTGADLSKADLRGADLTEANLYGAVLFDADLHGANLYETNLSGADLRGVNLTGANLTNAYLSEADLSSADLSEIKGKTIITFSAGKHFAYYCDGHIKIGCKYMTVEEWSKSYEEIGKSEGYSDEEIKRYARFIMMIMEEESE